MSPSDSVQAYAKAFYEAAMERWIAALDTVGDRLRQNPNLSERLTVGDLAARQRLLDSQVPPEADQTVRNLLYTLLQRDDLALLPAISGELRQIMEQSTQGPLPVDVTTAVDMTDDQKQALLARLQQQFGANLDLHYRVDPAILGGMVIRAGDKLIDGSVATRLEALKMGLGVASRR